jgi:hypothetical protein
MPEIIATIATIVIIGGIAILTILDYRDCHRP